MFTSDEIAALQAIEDSAMQDRCTIQRSTLTKDDTAGHTETRATVGTNVLCRVRSTTRDPQSKLVAEKFGVEAVVEVVLPINSGVQADDWLIVTPFQTQNSARELIVRYVVTSTYETGKVCICTES